MSARFRSVILSGGLFRLKPRRGFLAHAQPQRTGGSASSDE